MKKLLLAMFVAVMLAVGFAASNETADRATDAAAAVTADQQSHSPPASDADVLRLGYSGLGHNHFARADV